MHDDIFYGYPCDVNAEKTPVASHWGTWAGTLFLTVRGIYLHNSTAYTKQSHNNGLFRYSDST